MANIKISELTTATTLAATDELEINAAGVSKKATAQKVLDLTTGTANTFTAAQTFRAANAIRTEAASTQDAVVLAGRAGGTASYAVTVTPATLSANRTLTLPDANGTVLTTAAAVTVAQGGTGQTSFTDGQLLIGNSSDGSLAKANLTAGSNITITNGSGAITIAATASGGKAVTRQVFTASGTWTKPSGYGTTAIALLEAWGAGAGGYDASGYNCGGGGGGYNYRWVLLSAMGATETITIGAGSSNNSAADGGNSSVGSLLTAYGGGGVGGSTSGGGGGQTSKGTSSGTPGGPNVAAASSPYFPEGQGGSNGSPNGKGAMFKGGGGGGSNSTGGTGGSSWWGGGGGGANGGGSSVRAGAGGGTGVAGTAPAGGGGPGGAGARGEVWITVFDGV